jgi:hypothetical protein
MVKRSTIMRTFTNILLILAVILTSAACKKDAIDSNSALLGKWKLIQTSYSIGGPQITVDVPEKADHDYVQFDKSGKLSGTIFKEYERFTIKDSISIIVYKKDDTQQNYSAIITNGKLRLSPAGPIFCTEGCSQTFVKVE